MNTKKTKLRWWAIALRFAIIGIPFIFALIFRHLGDYAEKLCDWLSHHLPSPNNVPPVDYSDFDVS